MENDIVKLIFVLTLFGIMPQDSIHAANKAILMDESSSNDTCRTCKEFPFKEIDKKRSLDKLHRTRNGVVLPLDTGKYYREFFYNSPGWGREIRDSLFLSFDGDSVLRRFRFPLYSLDTNFPRLLLPEFRDNSIEMPNMIRKRLPRMLNKGFEFPDRAFRPLKNSQSFTFRNTDQNGITTHLRIDVNDPSHEEIERIAGSALKDELKVENLSFSPNFSTGTLTLLFNLNNRGAVKIKVLDNEFNTVFTDKTSSFPGSYITTLSLPRNGIYFLTISQNDLLFVKQLVKRE